MSVKKIHIISFNVPYPADYGGVIEIFFKLKTLKELGIDIDLHTFQYGRPKTDELNKYCKNVFYYKRKKGIKHLFNKKPYIVSSRSSKKLLERLLQDEAPILFEGLHTTKLLNQPELKNRIKIVRTHNIEHDYYAHLARNESQTYRRQYFNTEAEKLKDYEKILNKANHVLSISKNDYNYFNQKYKNAHYVPAFHPFNKIESKTGKGQYILYHGNLEVSENLVAVMFLINQIFRKVDIPVIIAGKNPGKDLIKKISKHKNIELFANPQEDEMRKLISNAHINVLPTFQNTGIKLKLLNSLFCGRFCIVNSLMVENTGLEELCIIKNSAKEITVTINELYKKEFDKNELKKREDILFKNFQNIENAKKIIEIIEQSK